MKFMDRDVITVALISIVTAAAVIFIGFQS